jgi:hypothetical protein
MVGVGQCGREVAAVEGWRPVEELIQWGFAHAPVVMANEAEPADPADRGPEKAARLDSP